MIKCQHFQLVAQFWFNQSKVSTTSELSSTCTSLSTSLSKFLFVLIYILILIDDSTRTDLCQLKPEKSPAFVYEPTAVHGS